MSGPKTPVLDKMKADSVDTQPVGEFIDWLQDQGIELCKRRENNPDRLYPIQYRIEELLAQWKGVDLKAAEAERVALLDYHRKQQFKS